MLGAPHASPCPERRHRFDCSKRWHGRTRSLRICGRESLKSKGGLCFWGTQKMATKPRLQHLQASVHHSKLQLGARTTVIVSSGSIQSFYLVIFDVLPLCRIDRLVRAPKKSMLYATKAMLGAPHTTPWCEGLRAEKVPRPARRRRRSIRIWSCERCT